MVSVLEQLGPSARVAVIRLRSLGDCVLTTPALEILHETRPDLEIAVVVEDRFREIFDGNPAVRAILPPTANAVRSWRPELVLNLHGGTRSMVLTAAAGARLRAGFAHHKGASLYNLRIPRAQEILGEERTVHTAEHLASAIFHLGAPIRAIPRARLYVGQAFSLRADFQSAQNNTYAVIHPHAATPEKTWPAERFAAVATRLAAENIRSIFISAATDDTTAFTAFQCLQGASLTEVKSLLASASLFIGNDSGPAHMAAAFGIPVIVLFGPSDPVVWAPWQTEAEVLASPEGIDRITTEQVTAAIDRLRVAQ